MAIQRWGIETSIVVPGAFTSGTNHRANAGSPEDKARTAEQESDPYARISDDILKGFAATAPPDANVAEVVNGVANRVRAELLPRRSSRSGSAVMAGGRRWCVAFLVAN
jgi:hypothetical protein